MDAKMMFPWMRWMSQLHSRNRRDGSTFSKKKKKRFL
ncbi:hypothetical protein Goshw_013076, partial [Gossypium schwendimanii]|nr:hypothetical protein [Gossypium schwendimanii]